MEMLLPYLKAFLVGGTLCLIGQLLIDKTKLTPARILTSYVVTGVVLGALGIYQPLVDFAGAGASVSGAGVGVSGAGAGVSGAGVGVSGAGVGVAGRSFSISAHRFLTACSSLYTEPS